MKAEPVVDFPDRLVDVSHRGDGAADIGPQQIGGDHGDGRASELGPLDRVPLHKRVQPRANALKVPRGIRHEDDLIDDGAVEPPHRVQGDLLVRAEHVPAGAPVEVLLHLLGERPDVDDRQRGIR